MTRARHNPAFIASRMLPDFGTHGNGPYMRIANLCDSIASIETPAMRWVRESAAKLKEMEDKSC